jgi:DNA-binding response OmpR family regulator
MARILIAEDDDNIRSIVRKILEGEGHEVETAGNGIEALSCACAKPFDLLVTDILMPEKTGIDLITELRASLPDLKILAMSAGGRIDATHYLRTARELGANETLIKPFNKEELLAAVNSLLTLAQVG